MKVTPEQQIIIDNTPITPGPSYGPAPFSNRLMTDDPTIPTPGKPAQPPVAIPFQGGNPVLIQPDISQSDCGNFACGSSPMVAPSVTPIPAPPSTSTAATPTGETMCTQEEQKKWWLFIVAAGIVGYFIGKK